MNTYERSGAGPRWLFLHGNGCDSSDWQAVWRHLPADWHLAAMDFRGHGASPVPREGVTLPDLAEDAAGLLERLGGKWVVVGHSLGGMVALHLAERWPAHVAGLVLLEGWTRLGCGRALTERFFGELPAATRDAIRAKSEATFSRWPAGLFETYWASVQAADAGHFLAATELPILEVYGDQGKAPLPGAVLGVPECPTPATTCRWRRRRQSPLPAGSGGEATS